MNNHCRINIYDEYITGIFNIGDSTYIIQKLI